MKTLQSQVAKFLGEDSPLKSHLTGFSPRADQQQMAQAVAEAIDDQQALVVEAGTGIGKTFAYALPAILSGKKVIISTASKNLQDQLFFRDLPMVKKALKINLKMALLKGRANYLCYQRLDMTLSSGRLRSRALVNELQTIRSWAGQTDSGDIAEVSQVGEDSNIWRHVTSTSDNCLGQDCPFLEKCCVAGARKAAQEADLLVINHHLFFADAALKDTSFGELLPQADVLIFDEAHQLADIAGDFLGLSLSRGQLNLLAEDVIAEQIEHALDMGDLRDAAVELQTQLPKLRLAMGQRDEKSPWFQIANRPELQTEIKDIKSVLQTLADQLKLANKRSKGLLGCYQRVLELKVLFKQVTDETPADQIHWFETRGQYFKIHLTPLSIAESFQRIMQAEKRSWVFTSATLTSDGVFDFFNRGLGLQNAKTLQLASPFDYPRQAVFYVPQNLPQPRAADYVEQIVDAALPVIEACKGRTFFLFTSHYALQRAAAIMADKTELPLLLQGSLPKTQLLNQYRELPNAVLLATSSFWEGVDVRGAQLVCVIIDKLPFAAPNDPVLQARCDAMRKKGLEPFNHYQLPQAVISLKQGAGRLIRDASDKGVLMVCDPRLLSRDYGKVFIDSLPPMAKTRHQDKVLGFVKSHI